MRVLGFLTTRKLNTNRNIHLVVCERSGETALYERDSLEEAIGHGSPIYIEPDDILPNNFHPKHAPNRIENEIVEDELKTFLSARAKRRHVRKS